MRDELRQQIVDDVKRLILDKAEHFDERRGPDGLQEAVSLEKLSMAARLFTQAWPEHAELINEAHQLIKAELHKALAEKGGHWSENLRGKLGVRECE